MSDETQKKQYYTTAEICEITGVSAPRVYQMRMGQTIKMYNKKSGTKKPYFIKPILVEDVHWKWIDSDVVFFPEGLNAILNRRKRFDNVGGRKKSKPTAPKVQSVEIEQIIESQIED